MRNERFEWDDRKAARNLKDHKVSFEDAARVFNDPNALEIGDPDPDEERYKAIGKVQGLQLTVIYTDRDPRIRIISARKANRHEQAQYENQGKATRRGYRLGRTRRDD